MYTISIRKFEFRSGPTFRQAYLGPNCLHWLCTDDKCGHTKLNALIGTSMKTLFAMTLLPIQVVHVQIEGS